jgi:hypothetical protein
MDVELTAIRPETLLDGGLIAYRSFFSEIDVSRLSECSYILGTFVSIIENESLTET